MYHTQGAVWQDLALGETVCATLSGFVAHNLERLVTEDDQVLQPGVRASLCLPVRSILHHTQGGD